jgi:hypothetical protein
VEQLSRQHAILKRLPSHVPVAHHDGNPPVEPRIDLGRLSFRAWTIQDRFCIRKLAIRPRHQDPLGGCEVEKLAEVTDCFGGAVLMLQQELDPIPPVSPVPLRIIDDSKIDPVPRVELEVPPFLHAFLQAPADPAG